MNNHLKVGSLEHFFVFLNLYFKGIEGVVFCKDRNELMTIVKTCQELIYNARQNSLTPIGPSPYSNHHYLERRGYTFRFEFGDNVFFFVDSTVRFEHELRGRRFNLILAPNKDFVSKNYIHSYIMTPYAGSSSRLMFDRAIIGTEDWSYIWRENRDESLDSDQRTLYHYDYIKFASEKV